MLLWKIVGEESIIELDFFFQIAGLDVNQMLLIAAKNYKNIIITREELRDYQSKHPVLNYSDPNTQEMVA